jgi:DNA-binding beta-propeller fold protein YncE
VTALKNILVLLLIVLAFVSGRSTFREMTVGAGPRVSSGPLQGDTRELAFVANAVAGTVSLLDLESLAVIKTLDITPDGKQVGPARNFSQWLAQGFIEARGGLNFAQDTDLSRDGTVLFVSRGFLGDVAAFDIASGELLWRAPVAGFRADHMTISPDGERLFVSTLIRSGNRVQVFATDTGLELGRLPRRAVAARPAHVDGTACT